MVLREELSRSLAELYDFDKFDDYCENGLQIEGKDKIEKIVFAVSFHLRLVEEAIARKADAIVVHHGIFDKGFFVLKGIKKKKVKPLLDHDISLFGIHLPMDAHPTMGHSACLMSYLEADNVAPFDFGVLGSNVQGHSVAQIVDIFHQKLHPADMPDRWFDDSYFGLTEKKGFSVLANGPEVPKRLAIVTGGSSSCYERAVEAGADTFISGEIKEKIPALSYETATNFINLGHYYSEKPGVLALQAYIEKNFDVQTEYVEIPNPV